MRVVMLLILAVMLAGVFAPLLVPGEYEQIPPGDPLEAEIDGRGQQPAYQVHRASSRIDAQRLPPHQPRLQADQ